MKLGAAPEPPMAGSGFEAGMPTLRGTIAEMAYAVIKQHGGPMRVQEVVAELVRLGKLKGSHTDYGTVFGTLARNSSRFTRAGKGIFAIVPPGVPELPPI